jgi:hypothetical protein
MRVFRSVDVVVQNHTTELLTMEDGMAVQGSWNQPGPPKIGTVVPKQGSGKWSVVSTVDNIGVEGFLRFGSTKGYIGVHWLLPCYSADEFAFSAEVPKGIECHYRLSGTNYDFRVVTLTLRPARAPD